MNIIEKTIRQFHESWDLRDPDRGEAQIGTDGYRMDYHRWRAAFPDGEVKVVNVITSGDELDGWAVVDFLNRVSLISTLEIQTIPT